MTIEKCKDFVKDGYGTWDDTSKPTTYANMYDFMKNQNNIVMNLASGIWQPSTSYAVGTIIRSPSLPAGCVATCTTAGTSGTTEPKWTAYGTTVTDGSCKWKINTNSQDTLVSERNKAIDSMHSTITGERGKALGDMHTTITGEITKAINALHDTIKSEMKTAMLALFPVGTILETTNSANPSTYIGGTWEQLDAGLTTITAGTYTETHNVNGTYVTDTYVFTAGSSEFTVNGTKTQGEAKHQITEGELASHTHTEYAENGFDAYKNKTGNYWKQGLVNVNEKSKSVTYDYWIGSAGGNQPHNNLPPVYGVFRFRRTT